MNDPIDFLSLGAGLQVAVLTFRALAVSCPAFISFPMLLATALSLSKLLSLYFFLLLLALSHPSQCHNCSKQPHNKIKRPSLFPISYYILHT